jgi:hypothetical protein
VQLRPMIKRVRLIFFIIQHFTAKLMQINEEKKIKK